MRLDDLLVKRGQAETRERAAALVMAGSVYINGVKADKPGDDLKPHIQPEVREDTVKWVSRGGLKLEKALSVFGIDLDGCCCMDIGASTGGFTDCMLQNGAKTVFAVDVGYGQLAWKLRTDERVRVMERTNIRGLKLADIGAELDFAAIDVAFISLSLVLPVASALLRGGGTIVCLVKPQFEAEKSQVGKNGVVREMSTHIDVALRCAGYAVKNGLRVKGFDYSPVKGPQGNIEYLLFLEKSAGADIVLENDIRRKVENSHENFASAES